MTVAQWAEVSNWFSLGSSKDVTGLSWSSGDIIVVMGGGESADVVLNTPTNANLTFTLRASVTTGGSSESDMYVWSATAGSSQSSQTVSIARSGFDLQWGFCVWVVSGSPTGVANAAANQTESAFNITVGGSSDVLYMLNDYNATNPPGKTPATGSGTSTERRDAGNSTNYAQYVADWQGVTAGTYNFGPNNYTSLQVAQGIIEVTFASNATATPGVVTAAVNVPAPTVTVPTPPGYLDQEDADEFLLENGTHRLALESGAPSSGGVEATPGVITAAVSVLAPTVSAGSTAAPGVVTATVSVPSPTPRAGVGVAPGVVTATSSVPAPTVTAGSTATPATVTAAVSVPAPTVSASQGASVAPTVVTATANIPAPTVTAGATATPAVVTATVNIPAPAISAGGGANVTPTTVTAVVTVPSPTVGAGSSVTPGVVTLSASVPAPTVTAGATATPGVVTATVNIPAPTVTTTGNATATPSTVTATVNVPAPTVSGGASVAPAVVTATVTVPVPTVTVAASASVTPGVVTALASVPAPVITVEIEIVLPDDWTVWREPSARRWVEPAAVVPREPSPRRYVEPDISGYREG